MQNVFFCRTTRCAAVLGSVLAVAASVISSPAFAGDKHEHHHHHHNEAKEVAAFHSSLAPLWHAPAGQARIDDACAQAAKLETLANDIKSSHADALKAAVAAFKEQCKTNPGEAEAAFGKLHDAFHKVAGH